MVQMTMVISLPTCFRKDGQIDADELQKCLTESGIAGGYKRKLPVPEFL